MQSASFHIRGVAPLIMHNARLSDPLDYWTRQVAEISGKRTKTIADHEEMARREFMGGLYTDAPFDEDPADGGPPVVPGACFERMIRDAAAKSRAGQKVQAGLIVPEDAVLEFKGPKDRSPEQLWRSRLWKRVSCKVQRNRVMRTRPAFHTWELKFEALFDDTLLNAAEVQRFVALAGQIVGLCDWRPRHGRFEVLK